CHGINQMAGGDTLEIRAGTYVERISGDYGCSVKPGSSGAPTTIRGAAGDTVTLNVTDDGAAIVELWMHPWNSGVTPQSYITFDNLQFDQRGTWAAFRQYDPASYLTVTNSTLYNNHHSGCNTQGAGCAAMYLYGHFGKFANLHVYDIGQNVGPGTTNDWA